MFIITIFLPKLQCFCLAISFNIPDNQLRLEWDKFLTHTHPPSVADPTEAFTRNLLTASLSVQAQKITNSIGIQCKYLKVYLAKNPILFTVLEILMNRNFCKKMGGVELILEGILHVGICKHLHHAYKTVTTNMCFQG